MDDYARIIETIRTLIIIEITKVKRQYHHETHWIR